MNMSIITNLINFRLSVENTTPFLHSSFVFTNHCRQKCA